MHIVGERRGGVALSDLLGNEDICLQVAAKTTMRFRNTKGQQARLAEVVIVLKRKPRFAIEFRRARLELLTCQISRQLYHLLLALGQPHIHLTVPIPPLPFGSSHPSRRDAVPC